MQIKSPLLEKAKQFASERHASQERKYEKTPYINHPIAVTDRVMEFSNNVEIIAAALLHDTIEDTPTKFEEIQKEFGEIVAGIVNELTSDKEQAQLIGKDKYLTHKINHMSNNARLIKLADREHNVKDLGKAPIEFQKRYAADTAYILNHLEFQPSTTEKLLIKSIWEKITPFLEHNVNQ